MPKGASAGESLDDVDEEEASRKKQSVSTSKKKLEELYDESSSRILQERNDFFLPQIRDFVAKEQWVNLRPEYQRRLRWDKIKQSRLIESLFMNVPVPPVFLYEHQLNRYEVMDGQQRLVSLLDFYDGKLQLTGLEAWEGLNGLRYSDLPARLQRGLDRRRISAVVLLAESAPQQHLDMRREVFSRLNTGGTALNNQELRNCVYAGPFNNLIIKLAARPQFRKMWGLPSSAKKLRNNKIYQTMADCQIALRFFAFRKKSTIRGSVRGMLDRCMETNSNLNKAELKRLGMDFKSRLDLAHQVFGNAAFRLPNNLGNRYSRPLFDAVMLAVDRLWEVRTRLVLRRLRIRKKLERALAKHSSYELIVGRPNTADSVKDRIALVEKTFRNAIS